MLLTKPNKVVLKQNIEKSHQDMISAYEKYKALLEQVNQYKESFRSAKYDLTWYDCFYRVPDH